MRQALVLSDHNMTSWRANHQRGIRPSVLPYGVDRIEHYGFTIVEGKASPHRLAAKVRGALEQRAGLALERPLRAISSAAGSDVVIALLETYSFLPALMKKHGARPYANRPLVALSCWLAQDAASADKAERARLLRRVEAIDLLFYLSTNQTEILADLGLDPKQLLAVPYGVDAQFYSPDDTVQDIDVLAVGHDRGRDYETLFRAVADVDVTVDLVCSPYNLRGLDVPNNVRLRGQVSHTEYRSLLRRSKVVAVPTFELAYPTGQSVALEASACGRCVVATSTIPLREYFEDGMNAVLVPPHDMDSLREALLMLLKDDDRRQNIGSNARENVVDNFTTGHMWDAVIAHLIRHDLI